MGPTAISPQSTCGLLQLPPELRNTIYVFAFAFEQPQDQKTSTNKAYRDPSDDFSDRKSLLLTCTEICKDTTLMSTAVRREYISQGTRLFHGGVKTEDRTGLTDVKDDVLWFAKEIVVSFWEYEYHGRSPMYEGMKLALTKVTAGEHNGWSEWGVHHRENHPWEFSASYEREA